MYYEIRADKSFVQPNSKGKVFYDQEPPSGESTTTQCGFN